MAKLNHRKIAKILYSEFAPVTKRTRHKGIRVADLIPSHTGPHGEVPCPACEKFKKRKAGA